MLQKQRLCCDIIRHDIIHDIFTSNSRLVYNTDILGYFMNGNVAFHPQLPA